jgi:uncharacterized protein
MDFKKLKNEIAERIALNKPYKAILFGSVAYGQPNEDSDIDLIVVLNKRGLPQTYNEKMENYRSIRKLLRDINEIVPLDIIVYTIDEWNSFIATGSSFSLQILEKGKAIA